MPSDHREQQQLARRNHQIYAHTRHDESEGDKEFSFWCSSSSNNNINTITSNENEAIIISSSLNKEAELPFLSHTTTHHYSDYYSDPSSRSEAIEEGRRELMEMVRDMATTHHDSSFELSFQDMVVHEKHVQNETSSLDNTHMHNHSGDERNSDKGQLKKKKQKKQNNKSVMSNKSNNNNNKNRTGQVLRVESMDSETFQLKMFFPISLKKGKVVKVSSKVSPKSSSSLHEPLKQVGKEWKIRKCFQTENNRGNTEDGMCSSDKSRNFDRKISFSSPGCWPFVHRTENKANKLAE